MRERRVLHILPHTGGGGDTYVDLLTAMDGYRSRRVYVAPQRKPGAAEVVAGIADLSRTLRGYDLLHVHGEATAALFLPVLAARRSVVTLHGLHLVRRVTGFGIPMTLCVTDVDRGRQRCRESTARSVEVEI